jgi:prepilin-type N-terminal cleavage/methylation domain-containing protein
MLPLFQEPARGYSLIELLLVIALATVLAGVAVPLTRGTVEELRAAGAARHLAAIVADARLDAIRRSSSVGLRFESLGGDYRFRAYVDGNGNGLRTAEITSGIDRPLARAERLSEEFPGVTLGLLAGIPDLDGGSASLDGVRIGSAKILSVSPDGSCTGGTLYIRGVRSQYAVRILGATGRARLFRFDRGSGLWITS